MSKKSEKETPFGKETRGEESFGGPPTPKKMFNLNNMSTPLVAFRGTPRPTPIPRTVSYFCQSDSDTDEEFHQEALGFPRPRYSRHSSKFPGLKKAMLNNISLADLLSKTKPSTANPTIPVTSSTTTPVLNTTTGGDVLGANGERFTRATLGSPIRLQAGRQTYRHRSPTPLPESYAPNRLTLDELRQLRSNANTTFHDARRFGNPQTPLVGMSRPVTPLPAVSPIRPETPSQRRKPVPAYLDTTSCGGHTESELFSAILSASRTTAPPRPLANVRLASDIYANPLASHSLGALKLYDESPTSPEDTAPFEYSLSSLGSISSSMSFSASSAASTAERCRSSLESVEQGPHANQISDVPSDDFGRDGHSLDHRSQHFVLSVDAPLSTLR